MNTIISTRHVLFASCGIGQLADKHVIFILGQSHRINERYTQITHQVGIEAVHLLNLLIV